MHLADHADGGIWNKKSLANHCNAGSLMVFTMHAIGKLRDSIIIIMGA